MVLQSIQGFLYHLHSAHCNQSHDYSDGGMVESNVAYSIRIHMRLHIPFQNKNKLNVVCTLCCNQCCAGIWCTWIAHAHDQIWYHGVYVYYIIISDCMLSFFILNTFCPLTLSLWLSCALDAIHGGWTAVSFICNCKHQSINLMNERWSQRYFK